MTSFFSLSVLEVKIFQYGFLEEHKVCENIVIDRRCSLRNEVVIMATKPEFLVAKEDIVVALTTISVAILSPGMTIKILCLS